MLSGLDRGRSILKAILDAVQKLGGEDEDALAILAEDSSGESLARGVACLLTGRGRIQLNTPQHVLNNARSAGVRMRVLEDVMSEGTLLAVATTDSDPEIRLAAIQKIESQVHLCAVVERGCRGRGDRAAGEAVKRIDDLDFLLKTALTHDFLEVQKIAVDRIAAIEGVHGSTMIRLLDSISEDDIRAAEPPERNDHLANVFFHAWWNYTNHNMVKKHLPRIQAKKDLHSEIYFGPKL